MSLAAEAPRPPAIAALAPRAFVSLPAAGEVGPAPTRTVVRLWLPLTPLWMVLAPFALIAAPLLLLAPQARGAPPFRTAFAVGRLLFALSGAVVEVDTPEALVRIRIV